MRPVELFRAVHHRRMSARVTSDRKRCGYEILPHDIDLSGEPVMNNLLSTITQMKTTLCIIVYTHVSLVHCY